MLRLAAVIMLCFIAISAVRAAPDPASDIRAALVDERLAGATWSMVDGDRIDTGAAGWANVATGTPLQPGDRVHVGSVTKTLVALGILRLVSIGSLDLDARVTTLIPGLRFANHWERTDPVRVRHLLDHSAGLEDAQLHHVFSTALSPDDPLRAIFDRDPAILTVRSRPGERTSYSNIGFTLAAMIIEAITRQRYERWLDANLLAPIGMRDSSFAFVSQTGRHADPRLAWGHHDDLTPQAAMAIAVRPAGQFTTTAHDMALLARFLMSDGSIAGMPFVHTHLLRAMGHPTGTAAARAGLATGYALGLNRRDRDGHIGLCHAGDIVGFHAMLCLYPEQAKAFFIAINTEGETVDYGRFDRIMAKSLKLAPPELAPVRAASPDADAWVGRYSPSPGRFEMFRYLDMLMGGAVLRRDGAGFVFDPTQGKSLRLTPAGGHLLRADGRLSASHALIRDRDGERLIDDGLRTYRRIAPVGFFALWASLCLGLIGMLHLAIVPTVRAWRTRRRIVTPGLAVPALLLISGSLFSTQSFMRLGEMTPGSVALALASVALPVASLWQAIDALRTKAGWWRLDLAASLLALQLCIMLATYGLIPLMLWR
jgi:CubicO group peptidase (beta-lactamase class C family)